MTVRIALGGTRRNGTAIATTPVAAARRGGAENKPKQRANCEISKGTMSTAKMISKGLLPAGW